MPCSDLQQVQVQSHGNCLHASAPRTACMSSPCLNLLFGCTVSCSGAQFLVQMFCIGAHAGGQLCHLLARTCPAVPPLSEAARCSVSSCARVTCMARTGSGTCTQLSCLLCRYLDFMEAEGNRAQILHLYERCLVACASYPGKSCCLTCPCCLHGGTSCWGSVFGMTAGRAL